MAEQDSDHRQPEFFSDGFFEWQLGGKEQYKRLYEMTAYNPEKYWGGFDHEPAEEAEGLPDWAIGPFEKYEHNPVFAPSEAGWDLGRFGGGVHNGSLLRHDGLFCYVYRGHRPLPADYWGDGDDQDGGMQDIDYTCDAGVATSPDGVNFTRRTVDQGIFRRGEAEMYSFEDNCVVRHDGTYYLFCNRWDWKTRTDPTRNGVFIATSTDLLNWTSVGLAFPEAARIHRNACVLQDPQNNAALVDGRFVMYLNDGLIAYSDDLLHWKSEDVPRRWPGGEGCFAVTGHRRAAPEDIVLFTGGHHTGHFYAIGEVLLSTDDPGLPRTWLQHPVLQADPQYPWENCMSAADPSKIVSAYRDTIFLTGMTLHEGRWYVPYGGSEYYTCLATAAG